MAAVAEEVEKNSTKNSAANWSCGMKRLSSGLAANIESRFATHESNSDQYPSRPPALSRTPVTAALIVPERSVRASRTKQNRFLANISIVYLCSENPNAVSIPESYAPSDVAFGGFHRKVNTHE